MPWLSAQKLYDRNTTANAVLRAECMSYMHKEWVCDLLDDLYSPQARYKQRRAEEDGMWRYAKKAVSDELFMLVRAKKITPMFTAFAGLHVAMMSGAKCKICGIIHRSRWDTVRDGSSYYPGFDLFFSQAMYGLVDIEMDDDDGRWERTYSYVNPICYACGEFIVKSGPYRRFEKDCRQIEYRSPRAFNEMRKLAICEALVHLLKTNKQFVKRLRR